MILGIPATQQFFFKRVPMLECGFKSEVTLP
jgi:hypothetical protein